jgi:hypothetical protein
MSESLSSRDRIRLATIARIRGVRAERLINYPQLKFEKSADAARKPLERLCAQGFLAASALPRGLRLFRLSSKGVAVTGAPPAYAASPSTGIAAEMLGVSALAWQTEEFLFPTKAELEELVATLAPAEENPKLTSRFVLRPVIKCGETELHLHAFMAELRPASDLARRVGVVLSNLRSSAVFRDLLHLGLLGFTIVVPSRGVKSSLERNSFEVETSIVVVEELQDLIAH